MSYVIGQNCCKDASCVTVCPVNCIHPGPAEPGFGSAHMLFVDPAACIDCGACADACPVDAVVPADTLSGPERVYIDVNAAHYVPAAEAATTAEAEAATPAEAEAATDTGTADGTAGETGARAAAGPLFRTWERPSFDWSLPSDFAGLDVAVVGTGPAGLYAAELLLLHTRSRVTLIDRLPMAGGLIRYGVAPDHPGTKRIGHTFARLYSHPRVQMLLGVEIGDSVSIDELSRHYDAVVYAVGASVGKRLGIPGEDLPGSLTGPQFVGWYNASPDVAADAVRLDHERAVVVGTGNVALDVARILSTDPVDLARTDMAEYALDALRASRVREVVVLGRRGPEDAAYTGPELLAVRQMPGVEVVVDDHDPRVGRTIDAARPGDHAYLLHDAPRVRVDYRADVDGPAGSDAPRRIVLRFHSTAERVLGDTRVDGVVLGGGIEVPAGPLVTAIGYGGKRLTGLPFDDRTGTVPNEHGRVDGVPGAYAVGWFKRGSSGGIGDNRVDAADTIRTLLDDAVAGRLPEPTSDPRAFARTVRRRHSGVLDAKGLDRVLRAEQRRGELAGRSAVKFATRDDLTRAGR